MVAWDLKRQDYNNDGALMSVRFSKARWVSKNSKMADSI